MAPPPELRVLPTPTKLFHAAADLFVEIASVAVKQEGKFTVALSGGSTPKSLYSLLATERANAVPWDRCFFFFGDERHVPPDHPESNYRMANEAMFSKTPIPPGNIFRMHTEKDAETAASEYEAVLRDFFCVGSGQWPRFDLILLGVGPDGHTASLFPNSAACAERSRLVVANWVEKFQTFRLTLTFPVLNHAACATFLASGADKTQILREVLENPAAGLPAQKVHPMDGRLIWMLDQAAAGGLSAAAKR